jgi:membrane protease subunit HflK
MSRRGLVIVLLFLAGLVLAVVCSGARVVKPGERVVVRRFGRLVEPSWGPGLHLGLPLGIDRLERLRTDEVRRLIVGASDEGETGADPATAEFLTGDLNLVRIQAVVQYRVANPAEMVVASDDVEALFSRLAESILSRVVASRGIDRVLRDDRRRIGAEVQEHLAAAIARDRLGLEVLGVSLVDARPPAEVAADFAAAQAAESARDRRVNDARTRADGTVTAARARARALLEAAAAAASRKLVSSRAGASRFLALLPEAQRSRSLTFQHLYVDTMQSLLARVRRKLVLPAGDSVDLSVLGVEE